MSLKSVEAMAAIKLLAYQACKVLPEGTLAPVNARPYVLSVAVNMERMSLRRGAAVGRVLRKLMPSKPSYIFPPLYNGSKESPESEQVVRVQSPKGHQSLRVVTCWSQADKKMVTRVEVWLTA